MFDNKEKDKQVKVGSIDYIVNNCEGGRTNINNKYNRIKQTWNRNNTINRVDYKVKKKIKHSRDVENNNKE